ncbi:histidine kinase [Mumia sp. ZJ430]|uniref:sensor histidine kinase n=1 Tax=Mumia sp. ZJ430 TaxID=2708083 RepID=UPI00141E7244|nr:histidine kinase [Mumia sp. ZJ430]
MTRRGSVPVVDRWVALVTGTLALVALAAFCVVTAVAPEAGVVEPVPSALGWGLGAVTIVLQAVALLWRRTAPRTVLLLVSLGMLLCAVWGLGDGIGLAQLAVFVASYTLGLAQPLSRSWPTFAAAGVLAAAGSMISATFSDEPVALALGLGALQGVGTVGLPLAVAIAVATRREIRQARQSRVDALERERGALVQAAVARERTAMARELHDIAAHHLSGIAVMTAAIGTQIDSDPEAAKAAVAQVRTQSTAVLRDLRSLVGLLREDDGRTDTPERVRPESLAGIPALVDDVSGTVRDVRLTVLAGDHQQVGHGVGPLGQLAAYRMAQEALANAARHAPGAPTEVTVDDRDPEAVLLTVRNDRPGGPAAQPGRSGFGLVGMRERAELTGASLDIGPTQDGGWLVRLRIPRDQDTQHIDRTTATTEDA